MKIVIYHNYCNDGKVAASVTQAGLERTTLPFGISIRCIPASYPKNGEDDILLKCLTEKIDSALDDVNENHILNCRETEEISQIYIVDFSLVTESLNALIKKYGCEITVLDHHKGAFDKIDINQVDLNVELVLDNTRSGCMIAFDYFYNNNKPSIPQNYPELVANVGYRDIWIDGWQTTFPNAKALHVGLFDEPLSAIQPFEDEYFKHIVHRGISVLSVHHDMEKSRATQFVDREVHFTFDNKVVKKVNARLCELPFEFVSEASHRLLERPDIDIDLVVSSTFVGVNRFKMSYRCEKPFSYARAIAKALGGNGHDQAAGSYIDCNDYSYLYSSEEPLVINLVEQSDLVLIDEVTCGCDK